MSVGAKKAVFGLVLGTIGIGVVVPLAFWFVALALDRSFGLKPILGEPTSQILCAACVLIGAFWISWAYSYLLFVGKGLPVELFGRALHPTSVLVTTGPYAYTRNPMILGVLFVLLGVALLEGSISGLVLVPISALATFLYLAEFEEKGLVRRFGKDYEQYRGEVPRLFPRFSAYMHEPAPEP